MFFLYLLLLLLSFLKCVALRDSTKCRCMLAETLMSGWINSNCYPLPPPRPRVSLYPLEADCLLPRWLSDCEDWRGDLWNHQHEAKRQEQRKQRFTIRNIFCFGLLWFKEWLSGLLLHCTCLLCASCLTCCCVVLQRDLDFTIDIDFKGQLCEMSKTSEYRMR